MVSGSQGRTMALLQETLSVVVKTGAMKPSDTRQAIVR
ncbi:hypothetical protein KL86PLE_41360 [uncultured Pleomorphomonas sp.]|jgi:hypothetical protein|uniref:Uncharacterized protein n=1 Tax=uncultured Pleomorphomonas sp. TaxID=442121 RepID=A0A212LJ25_9HYPH|nr:hypothetical protein KL86PLE_41360 [uncultured Pleomorphomonas sp.]